MPCQFCDTIKEKEQEDHPWSEPENTASRINEIISQLKTVSFLWGDEWLYKCEQCGQFYVSLNYNELINCWIEFRELRKVTEEVANNYLNLQKGQQPNQHDR